MSTASSIAVSGMLAASKRLEVAAENIANASSAGAIPGSNAPAGSPAPATPRRVDTVELSGGGTKAVVSNVSPAYTVAHDPTSPYANSDGDVAQPNIDLGTEVVNAVEARFQFAANAAVFKVSDRMMQDLLDILNDSSRYRRTDIRT
jgi:flagellar basal-body rod protein FlgC